MVAFTLILACFNLLALTQGMDREYLECPHLNTEQRDRLKALVVQEDVHKQLVGSARDAWVAKELVDEDPNTCLKHTIFLINDTALSQSLVAKGKWFGDLHYRHSFLNKLEKNVYLEVVQHGLGLYKPDLELARIYIVYAKNGVFGYYWCMIFEADPSTKAASLPSIAGVTVPVDDNGKVKPGTEEAVKEAVAMIKKNKEVLGDIRELRDDSC